MLQIDLTRLAREGRGRIDADITADHPFWQETELTPASALEVRLEAQRMGEDVVVRGNVRGRFSQVCRRCLAPVATALDAEFARVYRREGGETDDGVAVSRLPDGRELDVQEPLRELVILEVAEYVECRPDCRGLCPHCGADRNESDCDCELTEPDERWAPLRRLKADA